MGEKPVWRGSAQIGLMALPLQLHTAVRAKSGGPKMISKCCGGFVGYDYKCKSCGKPVKKAETKKGFQIGSELVVIDPAELEQLMPKSTKTIAVEGFAFANEINFVFGLTPYYTSPNTDPKKGGTSSALKVYQLIRNELELRSKVAFGQYVHKSKEYPCLLRPYQGRLVLQQLLWNYEVVNPPEIEACELTEREQELMGQLIEKLTSKLDHLKFKNIYQQKVEKLIEARVLGKEFTIEKATEPTIDLINALEASVKATAKAEAKVAVEAT